MFGALGFLPACGAILDLPDPTIDNDAGFGDGSTNPDGQVLGDGALQDGSVPPGDGSVKPDGSTGSDSGPDTRCDGGKECFGGACSSDNVCQPFTLTDKIAGPKFLAFDETSGLFVSRGNEAVFGVDSSGDLTTITTGENNLVALAANSSSVYFANTGDDTHSGTELISVCSPSGCTVSPARKELVTGGKAQIGGIALSSTALYFTEHEPSGSGGGIYACSLSTETCGASPKPSLTSPVSIHWDNTNNLYWDEDPSEQGIFTCATSNCVSSGSGSITGITDLTSDTDNIYFSTMSSVNSLSKAGGLPSELKMGLTNVIAIAVDAVSLYWLDAGSGGNGTLYSCTLDTCAGTITAIVPVVHDPGGLVLSSDSIYYTSQLDGKVFRLAK